VVYVILFPVILFLLFVLAAFIVLSIAADPLPWIVCLVICFGVFICCGYFFFRDVWREWRAERRSKP
jgi:hypothetical protein